MSSIFRLTTLVTIAVTGLAGAAHAKAAKCNIVGTWTDSYDVTADITSKKAGTATAPVLCSGTYTVKISGLTQKGGTFNATSTDKKCPAAVAVLAYEAGSCTKATGTLTVKSLGLNLNDTWTEKQAVRAPAHPSAALINGLK
jgi:hypothetical protein